MKMKLLMSLLFCLTLTAATGVAAQVSGTTMLTVGSSTAPAQSGALLTGATVNSDAQNCASSTISVAVPAGWTLVCARGFEGTPAYASNESIATGASGGITTKNAHSGSHSLVGLYNNPDDTVRWILAQGVTGSFTDIYISYWDYVDSNAYFGDSDYFYGGIAQPNVCGQVQDIQYDMQNFSPAPNNSNLTSTNVLISEGPDTQATPCMGKYQYSNVANMSMNQGTWRQYEMLIHPSTVVTNSTACLSSNNGSDCTGDGTSQFYVNGQLLIKMTNADLNGTTSEANAQVLVGGVLTELSGCGDWSAPTCTGSRPGALPPSPFNRYIDDIIILKK